MGFIASIFGGGRQERAEPDITPLPEPEPEETVVDPKRDAELAEATKARQQILARRGRSSLVTSRDGDTRSGVAINT